MPFTYNPPTRTQCAICDGFHEGVQHKPIIDTHNGKATSANNFPFHNWYNFVLGYSPAFPLYMLQREHVTSADVVVDPFMGSGTTLISCKMLGIPSRGIDANDFIVDAARTKLRWDIDVQELARLSNEVIERVEAEYNRYRWTDTEVQQTLFHNLYEMDRQDYTMYVANRRPAMLLPKYISDIPFAKASIINDVIQEVAANNEMKEFLDLALISIIVPISNIRYGPGFGVIQPRIDVDVLHLFATKLRRMLRDLETVTAQQRRVASECILGDARHMSDYLESNSVSLIITSPPYPGDHEYTKHTRLELIFRGYATNLDEFRVIKRRMIRASTTNLYTDDFEREDILNLQSIQDATNLIAERLEHDGATSGFEKLYTKLVWEYFGGMHKTLQESMKILRPGGKIALLVSDSHAFKMVHIQTAAILQEIGERIGFINPEIVLWQLKPSTSHKYNLRENVLILSKP